MKQSMFLGNNEIDMKGSYESEESKQPFQFSSGSFNKNLVLSSTDEGFEHN